MFFWHLHVLPHSSEDLFKIKNLGNCLLNKSESMVMASDQTIWASVFVRESNHEQDDRRLLAQSLVAHFHEARH